MYLIKVSKQVWVDVEKIESVYIHANELKLYMAGYDDYPYVVSDECKTEAINAINLVNKSKSQVGED